MPENIGKYVEAIQHLDTYTVTVTYYISNEIKQGLPWPGR